MKNRKLILFTHSYPYGLGELWKHNELILLSKYYEEIRVVPFCYGGNLERKDLFLDNVFVENPLFFDDCLTLGKVESIFLFLFSFPMKNLIESFRLLRSSNRVNFIKFFISIKKRKLILEKKIISDILKNDKNDVVLYFYWGLGAVEFLPFVDISGFKNIVVRMHRYDLYEHENSNYIPFRKALMNSRITILPSSDDGLDHLRKLYPRTRALVKTQRCGVMKPGFVVEENSDDVLRIVSCSLLVKVKRISMMVEAASKLKIPFKWIHIGYGELFDQIQSEINSHDLSEKFILVGKVNSEMVLDFYRENKFDLFINTSKSEGVPFSIMEALSVGIPVIATDAGGTKEIVDKTVGAILLNNFDVSELTKEIEDYYYKPKVSKDSIKQSAIKRFQELCDMENLTKDFLKILRSDHNSEL
jgi:colanic acid/amylovoran biosynthesis glycosyltransferase